MPCTGTEASLGPGHIVLDGTQLPPSEEDLDYGGVNRSFPAAPNALRGWPKHAHHNSKMADGGHLGRIEKSPYLRNSLTDRNEIWHGDA